MKLKKLFIILLTAILILPSFGCNNKEVSFSKLINYKTPNSIWILPSFFSSVINTIEEKDVITDFLVFFKSLKFEKKEKMQDGVFTTEFENALTKMPYLNAMEITFNYTGYSRFNITSDGKVYNFKSESENEWYESTTCIDFANMIKFLKERTNGSGY